MAFFSTGGGGGRSCSEKQAQHNGTSAVAQRGHNGAESHPKQGNDPPGNASGCLQREHPSGSICLTMKKGSPKHVIYNEEECVICLAASPTQLLGPCGHLCCCKPCVSVIRNYCPICRSDVKEIAETCNYPFGWPSSSDLRLHIQLNPPAVCVDTLCYAFIAENLCHGHWLRELDRFDVDTFFTPPSKECVFVGVTKKIIEDTINILIVPLEQEEKRLDKFFDKGSVTE